MYIYIFRRILLVIPTMLLVTLIVFLMTRLIPGDIIDVMISEMSAGGGSGFTSREALEKKLGLDQPLHIQYGKWLGNILFHGNLGEPLLARQSVSQMIGERIGVTIELTGMSILISLLISLPIGIYSAIRQDSVGDYLTRSLGIIFVSVPPFWTATMIMVYPAIYWGWAPSMELARFSEDALGHMGQILLPAVVLGMAISGLTMRMTRTMMLEVLRQDYIRTAWSKGLRERLVVIRHAVKNAMIPVLTLVALQVPTLIGGAVIIEEIFVLPGIGQLLVDAVTRREYPIVSGVAVVFGAVVIITNLITDISYSWLDPRVHYQ
jgi:peptide/nickel transport system permease protein